GIGHPDAQLGRSLLLAGQCRDRGRRCTAAVDLAPCRTHQEHSRRPARLACDRRAQGGRSPARGPAHLVAGFGRIVDLKPRDILTDTGDAAELLAAEPAILAHMNSDHGDAARLYATKLLGAPDGEWRCVGCDPEGLELQLDRTALRLPF